MSVDFDVIVIGAGLGGLAAATTLQRGGLRTLVVERHSIPGGAATSFVRGRFEFEVSLHQLGGMGGHEPLKAVLDELDVTRRVEWLEDRDLCRTFVPGEVDVTLPHDWEALADVLDGISPGNRTEIVRFLDLVRETGLWQLTARVSLHRMKEQLEWLRTLPDVRRYALRTFREVLDEFFTDDRLKLVLSSYWSYNGQLPHRIAFVDMARLLALYVETKPYQVVGGSQALSSALVESFEEAGGELRLNTDAERILTSEGAVVGVRLEGGETLVTRQVISNAPSTTTYTRLLDDPDVVPARTLKDLRSRRLGSSATCLFLGLDASAEELGFTSATTFLSAGLDDDRILRAAYRLDEPCPFVIATCYDVRPTGFAPSGGAQVVLSSIQYAEPWEALAPEDYAAAKASYARSQLELAESMVPGLRDSIEEAELATPLTFKRYTNQPGGAIYGFDQDITDSWLFHDEDLRQNVPGLLLTSNWTTAGGYNSNLVTAARRCQRLLAAGV
ncbi:phytoene desaturase family protein [Streptomyces profundus]|uniref:phytoene desaturase family protein n=1 Tax=Streptomyces profundus TaxID=2867410 RepID=UPI001D16400A|nr:NAD(P)/FAD-dependent oxidoreductase [Streptomyces sp. MA3_2.13]UED86257.1 NAD(P)/FAD-dependent oxidoreductase [Streptomyces sp. MA3_2.13]